MADTTQQFIDDLITIIGSAEDAESVTNEMVARIFDFLNKGYKDVSKDKSLIATEKAERQTADSELQKMINSLQTTLQPVMRTAAEAKAEAAANRTAIDNLLGNNASTAIDNFNEIITFLAGVSDDENLVKKLTELKTLVNSEISNRENAIAVVEKSLNTHKKSSTEQLAAHRSRLDALENKAIMPIAGEVWDVAQLEQIPYKDGEYYYVHEKRQFRMPGDRSGDQSTEEDQTLNSFYNRGNTAREDVLYCDGMTFYRFVDDTEDEGGGLLRLADATDIRDINSAIRYIREDYEADVADHREQVGIVAFEAIVDEHPSVMTSGSWEDVSDGIEAHVVFDRSRGKFLWEVHDDTYECPAGDAWLTWPRASEFMTADGAVRSDRIYRCGSTLYRFDGTTLVETGAKMALFIDQWNLTCGSHGRYNPTTGFFELNGLTDITYAEALVVYTHRQHFPWIEALGNVNVRTNLMVNAEATGSATQGRCTYAWANPNIEVVLVGPDNTSMTMPTTTNDYWGAFCGASKLRKVLGTLFVKGANLDYTLHTALPLPVLEEIKISGLDKSTGFFKRTPVISLSSLQFLVANAANTSAITVTVHADVYAKLTTGDTAWQKVRTDGAARNIAFASA